MFGKSLSAAALALAATMATASDLSLEPCVNGDVSNSGNHPSQATEREINAYLNWRSYEPYYLFAVSAKYLELPFEDVDARPGPPRR